MRWFVVVAACATVLLKLLVPAADWRFDWVQPARTASALLTACLGALFVALSIHRYRRIRLRIWLSQDDCSINLLLAAFCVVSLLACIVNSVGRDCYLHLALFAGSLCLLSPLAVSPMLADLRALLWRYTLWGLRASVVLNLLYLPVFLRDHHLNLAGYLQEPNTFAFICAFVAIDTVGRLLKGGWSRWQWLLWWLLLALCAVATALASSRCCMAGILLGVVPLIIAHRRNRKMWISIGAFVIVGATAWMAFNDRASYVLRYKAEKSAEAASITYSRDELWRARVDEFKSAPILGIGFTVANPVVRETTFENGREMTVYTLEPGSSWLSVLSNTGIAGLLLFVAFNLTLWLKLLRYRGADTHRAAMLAGLLIAFTVNMFFEGWALYGGAFIFYLYWLLTSRIASLGIEATYRHGKQNN